MEKYITYPVFYRQLQEAVSKKLSEGMRVELHRIKKNNGVEADALLLLSETGNFSPSFYLSTYYEKYKTGYSVEDLAQQIVSVYQEEQKVSSYSNFCLTLDSCKDRIFFRLVSHEKNKKILTEIPHLSFLDLSIVFYLLIGKEEKGIRSIRVSNHIMEHWGLDTTAIFRLARENTERLFPRRICSMVSMISELLGEETVDSGQEEGLLSEKYSSEDEFEPFVITNEMGINGAAVILYEHALEELGVLLGGDYYLLPSSIHEMLAVAAAAGNRQELRHMVEEVNTTCVDAEEILSNQVYYYSVAEKIVRIC